MSILGTTRSLSFWLNGTHSLIQCAFIHDNFETRFKSDIHQRYKTKVCVNYSHQGYCKYGDRCLFLHYNETPSVC